MRALSTGLVLFYLLSAFQADAQLSFGGHPYGTDRYNGLPVAPVSVLPPVDVAALMAEDAERATQGKKGPYRFGSNQPVDIGLDNGGIWHTMANGDRVWRASVQSPGAFSINLEFHDFVIPDGGQVFVYNDQGDVLGGFEAGSNPGHTQLGVDLLAGDQITVEYVEPARVAGQGRLRIGQVTHGYRDILGVARSLNESGACNNNVICPEGDPWRAQIRSVAMIVVQGDGICTGQLINNCSNDGTPYFLTANHCLGGTNWVFRFNWNSPTCTPTANASASQSISGFTLLESSAGSDVALLRLNSTPPAAYNVFYTGWDRGASAATGGVTGIHHPSGDIKKISFETQAVVTASYAGAQCWRVPSWNDGTTEGGSSGSGLWSNTSGLLVGQLYGGEASCQNNVNDYYGKFSVSYPLLEEWLGDCGPTLQGYPDPLSSVQESADGAQLDIWPNPANGTATIRLPHNAGVSPTIRIHDAVGRVVDETRVGTGTELTEIDLRELPVGLYLVEARWGEHRSTQRLVVSR